MKVLIVGGTGLIGGAVAKAAVNKGADVYVAGRSRSKDELPGVTFIRGDWFDDAFAKDTLKLKYDVVIDSLIFNEDHMRRTMSLIEGCCDQFIYISTDSVYKHPGTMVSESDPIDDGNVKWKYGADKRKAELYLQKHAHEYSYSWTVIRPTITFGDTRIPVGFAGKRNTYDLCRRIEQEKPVIRFDDPDTRHALCHTSVFGEAAVRVFGNKEAYGQFFHISDDDSYTYGQIFEVIEQILGKKGKYVFYPPDVLKKDYPDLYEEMIYDKNPEFTLDNTKIRSLCSEVPFNVGLKDAMLLTIENLRKNADEGSGESDYDLLTDRLLLLHPESDTAKEYVSGLTEEYKTRIEAYAKKEIRDRKRQKVIETLRRIKRGIM